MRICTLLAALFFTDVDSFALKLMGQTRSQGQLHTKHANNNMVLKFSRRDLIGKEFQLEEREDKDTAITELWLLEDGSVKIGATDGPLLKNFKGSWTVKEDFKGNAIGDNAFQMSLVRTYEAGEHTGKNQVGSFPYYVERRYLGDIDTTGEFVSVSGTIHGNDEGKKVDCEVGYFALIDEAAEEATI